MTLFDEYSLHILHTRDIVLVLFLALKMSCEDNLRQCAQDIIQIDKEIIGVLNELLKKAKKVRKDVLISKTAGVTTGALGTITSVFGVLLVPVTAGLSLGLTIAGVVLTGSGAVINIGASIGEIVRSKEFCKKLRTLTEQHDKLADNLKGKVEDIRESVRILMQDHALDETSAIWATLRVVVLGGGGIASKAKTVFTTRSALQIANAAQAVSSTGSTLTRTLGGNSSIAFTLGKSMTDMTKTEMNGIIQVIKTPSSVAKASSCAPKNMLTVAVPLVSIVFTLLEVKGLVDDWYKKDPTIEAISNMIGSLGKEQEALKLWLKSLKNV